MKHRRMMPLKEYNNSPELDSGLKEIHEITNTEFKWNLNSNSMETQYERDYRWIKDMRKSMSDMSENITNAIEFIEKKQIIKMKSSVNKMKKMYD